MKRPLDKVLQDHLNGKRLDRARLDALKSMQQAQGEAAPARNPARMAWVSAVAGLVLVAGVVVTLLVRTGTPESLVDRIAAEVVSNHLHMKPLEVSTSSIDGIQDYFTRLDFMPVDSRYLADRGLALLGGRYCSLQDETAAQLRFRPVGENGVQTLYQVGHDPRIFPGIPDYDQGETPVSTWSNGIKVTLWVEKGVLFALTEGSEGRPAPE